MDISVDVGFGSVKAAVYKNSEIQCVQFPSAVGYSSSGCIELGKFAKQEKSYSLNGEALYLVGDDAVNTAITTRDLSFLIKFSPLFIYKALCDLNLINSQINLALGLPLYYFSKYKDELKRSVFSDVVNGASLSLFINKFEIYPQGIGALMDYMIDDKITFINEKKELNSVIADIGYNTIDIIITDSGRAVKGESDMLENAGIVKISKEMQNYIKNNMDINLSEAETQKAIIAKSVYGKDLSNEIHSLSAKYAEWLIQEIKSRFKERINRSEKIIFTGGGVNLIKNELKDFKKAYIPNYPEFSNARGFLKSMVYGG